MYDYIKCNMDGWHGDFTVAVTDLGEREERRKKDGEVKAVSVLRRESNI